MVPIIYVNAILWNWSQSYTSKVVDPNIKIELCYYILDCAIELKYTAAKDIICAQRYPGTKNILFLKRGI